MYPIYLLKHPRPHHQCPFLRVFFDKGVQVDWVSRLACHHTDLFGKREIVVEHTGEEHHTLVL